MDDTISNVDGYRRVVLRRISVRHGVASAGRGDYDHDDDAVSQAILARRTLELAFSLAAHSLSFSRTLPST